MRYPCCRIVISKCMTFFKQQIVVEFFVYFKVISRALFQAIFYIGKDMPFKLKLLLISLFIQAFGLCEILAAPTGQPITILFSEELNEKGEQVPIPADTQKVFTYIEKHIGNSVVFKRYPWARALKMAEDGEGVIWGISQNEERLMKFRFSLPVFSDRVLLVTKCKDKANYSSISDLKGKVIGLVRGTIYGNELDRMRNDFYYADFDNNRIESRLQKLMYARVDALFFYSGSLSNAELENNLNSVLIKQKTDQTNREEKLFCVIDKDFASLNVYFATKLDADNSVINKINEVILKMKKEPWFMARKVNK
ncbi:substrate-binding periplasmic protein [Undibacterium sp. Ji67W]|uniref:substrate-binding periplasmic protein n=1 Tax=Undibacterium sp. Ji67W TaxID=3413042 RepID=UPI003BF07476